MRRKNRPGDKKPWHGKYDKFNKYLDLQIKALLKADPMLDAKADKVWAELERTKYEFTLTRECYQENLTKTIFDNVELSKRLADAGIETETVSPKLLPDYTRRK